MDLEKVNRASLVNALTQPSSALARRLPSVELEALGIMLARTVRRYPSQENGETIEEYLTDFEQLALKYSLQKIADALAALRIDPDQEFFPKPNEVAHEIEQQQLKKIPSHVYARG